MSTIWQNNNNFGGAPPPTASSTNLFYNPSGNYGQTQNWNDSPLGGIIREQNPQLAYAQYGQGMGVGDTDNGFNRWFYQQFPRFERGYGLATLQNPLMKIDDFLATLPGLQALKQQYNMASPTARGISYSAYAPGVRWIGR